MAAQVTLYSHAAEKVLRGSVHWEADVIRMMLLSPVHKPRLAIDEYLIQVRDDEIPDGGGYTRGGIDITGRKIDYAFRQAAFTADALSHPGLRPKQPFQHGVVYCARALPEDSPLICHIDFGAVQDPAGLPFCVQWAPTGVFYIDGIEMPKQPPATIAPIGPPLAPQVSLIDRLIAEIREQRAA